MCIRLDTKPALDGRTDGIGKTITRSTCIACWRAIKSQPHLPQWGLFKETERLEEVSYSDIKHLVLVSWGLNVSVSSINVWYRYRCIELTVAGRRSLPQSAATHNHESPTRSSIMRSDNSDNRRPSHQQQQAHLVSCAKSRVSFDFRR